MMTFRSATVLLALMALPCSALAVFADDKSGEARAPGSVTTTLMLAGGYEVDVTVEFEDATNLSLANVGISASTVDPLGAALLARLPAGTLSIPAAFPVIVDISPPGGLTPLEFEGTAVVTLDTHNLPYYDNTRLRLLSAHAGGDFVDITDEVSEGSYRVRGAGGEFSEFLIAQDDRSNSDVVDVKLAALQARLLAYVLAIDATVYATLTTHLLNVETHWLADERTDAVADLDLFVAEIVASTPAQIPDSWTPGGLTDNVNGILRGLASTLRFSLVNDSPCPALGDYTDGDLDGVPNECDNCTLVANPTQCDTNGDGYGNECDADLNDNGIVNFVDLGIMKGVWMTADADADLNCNGVVNFVDLGILKLMFLSPPGPSSVAP